MNSIEKLSYLGATVCNTPVSEDEKKVTNNLPKELSEILLHFKGDIEFSDSVWYIPISKNRKTAPNGMNLLDMIYGIKSAYCNMSFSEINNMYSGRIGDLIIIGSAPGGNQICLNNFGNVFLWDHEREGDENSLSLIANSLTTFIESLVFNPDELTSPEPESIDLDF